MNRKVFFVSGGIILFLGMVLAACKPASPQINDDVKQPSDFVPLVYAASDCSYGGLFRSMETVDAYTVRFTFCSPEPAFLSKIASGAFGIYPKEFLEKYAGTSTLLEKPVGTGPYMVTDWKRGEELDFQRFDGYWSDPARVSTLIFRWDSDASQRLQKLQAGSVDGMDGINPADFYRVTGDTRINLFVRPALNTFYLGMNNTYKPFDNEKVRQAIAMGIDRSLIVESYYPPGSEVAAFFTPCSIPNGCSGEAWYLFNPLLAQQLLKDAGYPNGFDTVIYYRDVNRSYLPQPGAIAQEIQIQLQTNLNINARIEAVDKTTFLDLSTNGQLRGLHLSGWSSVYPDVTAFLDFHFGLGSPAQFGKGWVDIIEALLNGASLANDAARRPYYEIANNAIKQHVPVVPIAHGNSAMAFRKNIAGAYASPFNMETFALMSGGKDSLIFVQNSEPGSLYCSDETDGDTFRACSQVVESLMRFKAGGMEVEPALATRCVPNEILEEWTCYLRQGVKFQDGTDLDAGDVVTSLYAEWDATSPLHKGSTGTFQYWKSLWGGFLNSTSK